MPDRYWPLGKGRIVTSPFGNRPGGFHTGCDFGRAGGSGGMAVYAPQSGTVIYAGAAQGYGQSADGLAGWLVIDSDDQQGGGVFELGHIRRLPSINVGARVVAGQQVGVINPDSNTNGGVAPHLHVSHMPYAYNPATKDDPLPVLPGAKEPEEQQMPATNYGDPVWLADVLRAKRPPIKVAELPGWQQYGHGDFGEIWGVMIHHTGNARADAMSILNGRPDLEGPVSNLHIAQDGTVTVVAAGVCWHAGNGEYPGIPAGQANQYLIGIECAWPRDTSITQATEGRERWPDAEIIAMRDSVAAILAQLGRGADRVIGHKEWAGRVQGKWDPGNLSMNWFRGEVAKSMRGAFDQPTPPAQTVAIDAARWQAIRTHSEALADLLK